MVKRQVERLKKDLRNLETFEYQLFTEERYDIMKSVRLKKEYLKDQITQLLDAA